VSKGQGDGRKNRTELSASTRECSRRRREPSERIFRSGVRGGAGQAGKEKRKGLEKQALRDQVFHKI